MGTSPPKLVGDLEARDMTGMSDIPDRVPSPDDRKVFLSPDFKEEQLRLEFLNPFFESLGWDVSNKAGLTEVFESVNYEKSAKSRGDDSVAVTAPRRGRAPKLAGLQTPKPSLISLTSMLISC
jgi:hypothetical protein